MLEMSHEEDNLDLCDTPTGSDHMSTSSNHALTRSKTFHGSLDTDSSDVKHSKPLVSCSSVIDMEELVDYDEIIDELSSPVLHRKQIITNTDHDRNYNSDSDSKGYDNVIEISPEKNCNKCETLLQPGKSFLVKDTKEDVQTQETGTSRKRHSDYSDSSDDSAFDKCNLSKIFKLSPKVSKGKGSEVDVKRGRSSEEKYGHDNSGGEVCKQESSLPKEDQSKKTTIPREDLTLVVCTYCSVPALFNFCKILQVCRPIVYSHYF